MATSRGLYSRNGLMLFRVALNLATVLLALPALSAQSLTPVTGTSFENTVLRNGDAEKYTHEKNARQNASSTIIGAEPKQPYKLTGRYHLERGSNRGYLVLQVELEKDAYIHSLTLEKGLHPSTIEIQPTDQMVARGTFQPDLPPSIIEHDPTFECRMEKHFGKVQFFIPTEFNPNIDLERFKPQLNFSGQVCTAEGVCIPLRKEIVPAQFSGFFDRPAEKMAERSTNPQK